jgi:cytochrome c oxidase subunit III
MSTQQAILAHHFENLEQQRQTETLGMWAFLATEIMIFGGLFAGYAVYQTMYRDDFEAASAKLNVLIGAINTIVLLSSSLTMALAVYAARTDRQRMLVTCLSLTVVLGLTFLGFKTLEYYTDYQDKLVPALAFDPAEWTGAEHPVNPGRVQLFLMFYYMMTGLHATHMIVGIGVLGLLIFKARRGTYGARHYMPIELIGLYWHFVDVIWIFLLPLLYLIGTHSWRDLHF